MTNREIARQLGISPAALSLIINNKPGVSDETREKIKTELKKMGYGYLIKPLVTEHPAAGAPAPSVGSGDVICFVAYKRNNVVLGHHPFFMLLMESIEARAQKYGCFVQFMTINRSHSPINQIRLINQLQPKGVIVMATEMLDDDLALFDILEVPVVYLDNNFSYHKVNCVSINNEMGTFQAIEHLVSMGHTRIGLLHSANYISSWDEREQGFLSAMKHFGCPLDKRYFIPIRYNEEGSYQDFRQLLESGIDLPTAFVSDDDVITFGVLRALKEAGYRIPEDISLVGFNNRPGTEETEPQLTSVNVPKYSFGSEAVDTLVALINNLQDSSFHGRPVKHRISTELISRSSVKDIHN